jgi:hypothetical protein
MDKVEIAQGVADRLFATEAAVDAALAEASMLVAEMMHARQSLKVSISAGDDAVAKVSQVISALADARKTMVEAHQSLNESKLRLGIRAKMVGSPDKNDEIAPVQAPENVRELRRAV